MKYISMVKETYCISAWPWNILNFQEKENLYKLQGKSLYYNKDRSMLLNYYIKSITANRSVG